MTEAETLYAILKKKGYYFLDHPTDYKGFLAKQSPEFQFIAYLDRDDAAVFKTIYDKDWEKHFNQATSDYNNHMIATPIHYIIMEIHLGRLTI